MSPAAATTRQACAEVACAEVAIHCGSRAATAVSDTARTAQGYYDGPTFAREPRTCAAPSSVRLAPGAPGSRARHAVRNATCASCTRALEPQRLLLVLRRLTGLDLGPADQGATALSRGSRWRSRRCSRERSCRLWHQIRCRTRQQPVRTVRQGILLYTTPQAAGLGHGRGGAEVIQSSKHRARPPQVRLVEGRSTFSAVEPCGVPLHPQAVFYTSTAASLATQRITLVLTRDGDMC